MSTLLLDAAPTQVTGFGRGPGAGSKPATSTPSPEISARYFASDPASRRRDRLKVPCWTPALSPIGAGSAIAAWEKSRSPRAAETEAIRKATGVPGPPLQSEPSATACDSCGAGRTVSPSARFLQYKIDLTPAAGQPEPEVSYVEVAYLPKNVAPAVEVIDITPANYRFPAQLLSITPSTSITLPPIGQQKSSRRQPSEGSGGSQTLNYAKGFEGARWLASDENNDTLVYRVEIRGVKESGWKLLKENVKEKYLSWDTAAFPDGEYVLRVTASDSPSNPPDQALTASLVSDPFLIDNTPPQIANLTGAAASGNKLEIRWSARDARSTIDHAEYSVNGGDWVLVGSRQPPLGFTRGRISSSDRSSVIRRAGRSPSASATNSTTRPSTKSSSSSCGARTPPCRVHTLVNASKASDTPPSSPAPIPSPSQSAPVLPCQSPGTIWRSSSTRVWHPWHPPAPARTETCGTVPASPHEWNIPHRAENGTAGGVERAAEADVWCDKRSAARTRAPSCPHTPRYDPDRRPSNKRSLAARSSWCSRAGIGIARLSLVTHHASNDSLFRAIKLKRETHLPPPRITDAPVHAERRRPIRLPYRQHGHDRQSLRRFLSIRLRNLDGQESDSRRPVRVGHLAANWRIAIARSSAESWKRPRVNDPKRSAVEQKIGDFYASCMDESAIDKLGIQAARAGVEAH